MRVVNNKINLTFKIAETEKIFVNKINIYGNNITSENVLCQFEVDEGDPYNEILIKKYINNLKIFYFFQNVEQEIIDDRKNMSKIINIYVEEKPTGEISAQAGVGTDGGSLGFGVKENNFLGKGVILDSNISLSSDTFKGKFSVINRNYKNSDKSLKFSAEAIEIDNFKTNVLKPIKLVLVLEQISVFR